MENGIHLSTAIAIFGGAFGCWAWVVMWGVSVIRKEVAELKQEIHSTGQSQQVHINQTERRLTMLETEFSYVKAHLLYRPTPEPLND
jgi:5-bromo-4-chloroindolyl phosphate hydrolysis protein